MTIVRTNYDQELVAARNRLEQSIVELQRATALLTKRIQQTKTKEVI